MRLTSYPYPMWHRNLISKFLQRRSWIDLGMGIGALDNPAVVEDWMMRSKWKSLIGFSVKVEARMVA